ncbi:putative F-box/kelch-repeat protein [Raphanus sativus]|nr:putative F-box/kelch-repeat protein [Raphanus sativus]
MNVRRHNFAYAVVDGLLYVIRGYSADDVGILNAEVYNPKTNKWSLMDCPHRPNFRPAFAFSFNSKLFVVGNESRFIDIYDHRTKIWEELDSGQTLSVYSYTVVRNKVYFMNMNVDMAEMGVFDPEKNSWSLVDVPRGLYRLG